MTEWILLACVVVAAGLLQGATGFGYSLLLVSVMAVAGTPIARASHLSNITCLFTQAVIMFKLRRHFALRQVWPMLIGAALGVLPGVWLLGWAGSADWIQRLLGAVVTAIALWLMLAPQRPRVAVRPRRLLGLAAGLASGLAGGLFNIGGPPAVLYTYSRPISLDAAKATVQVVFTGMTVYRLVLVVGRGMLDGRTAGMALAVCPLVVAGAWAGVKLAGRIHPHLLRRVIFAVLVLVGLKLMLWP